ncbi:MAG: sulfatase-like hydrolase/transferase [Lachnospiraceae bacterium]|nr:sulfatase-like hydrolase/transferase [Lachnospiraceae bacterium]
MSSSTHAVEEAENNGKKGKAGRIIGSIALIVLVFISVFLLFAAMWLIKSFAGVTTEEIVYHLSYSMEGANTESATDYLLHYAIPTLIIVGILVAAYFLIISKVKTKKALLIANFGMVLVSLGCIAGCVLLLVKKTDVINYISGLRGDNSFIEDNYVDTQSVQLTFPEKKRNLIYIYMESMEVTYSDKENGGAFDVNLIPELTQLSKDNIDFSGNDTELNGGLAYSGAQWTMGAMFTMSTGLPLKTSLPDPNDLDTQENMYPGVVAIGDILKNEGYHNALMIGSYASFGGRELFYKTHGGYDILDYVYAKDMDYIADDYSVNWGYEDEKLYDFSKKEILKLASEEEPFNFTMLTVDTHASSGYVCDLCGNDYDLQYANVMACADHQVTNFIDWIKEQDFYENTTIIIVGDHPTMSHDFDGWIGEGYERKVFTTIINPATEYEDNITREYSTLDMFPTTLAAMGVTINGDRLALGTNLFSEEKTLTEKYGVKYVAQEMTKRSEFMDSLNEIVLTENYRDRMEKETTLNISNSPEGGKIVEIITQSDIASVPNLNFSLRAWGVEEGCVIKPVTEMEKTDEGLYRTTVSLEPGKWAFLDCLMYKENEKGIVFKITKLDTINDVVDYLSMVSKGDFDVLICARDDMANGLDDDIVNGLKSLGLQEDLVGKIRYSYAAVITEDEVKEELNQERCILRGRLKNDQMYLVRSAGYNSGDFGSIMLDGTEYSVNKRGLNFVLIDRRMGYIVHSVNFDTCVGRISEAIEK